MDFINISLLALCGLAFTSYWFGQSRVRRLVLVQSQQAQAGQNSIQKQHSLNRYHGGFVAVATVLPAALILLLWQSVAPLVIDYMLTGYIEARAPQTDTLGQIDILVAQTKSFYQGLLPAAFVPELAQQAAVYYERLITASQNLLIVLLAVFSLAGFSLSLRMISIRFRARHWVERVSIAIMIVAACISILTTVGIFLSLIFETLRFFGEISITEFLFGTHWAPQIAIREDQAGGSGAFGAIPLFAGTLLITFIAMIVAVPVGLLSAIYLSEYAHPRVRSIFKPSLEILAGIPTVVYGFFAALVVAPVLRDGGASMGLTLSSESALAAGLVMGIMVIPFISSLSDDVMNAVPQSLRDGAAALGATQSETIRQVIVPAALPGIVSAVLLAMSRAIGETMIVVMAAGVAANLTANPFESVTTVTVQIVMLLIGDQEFDSAKTLAAFALGMVLFIMTLILNILALYIVRKYREQYD